MHVFLSGYDVMNRATGLLEGWPWAGVLKSVCAAAVLFWISMEIVEGRAF